MTPPARIPHDVGLLVALLWVRDGRVAARGPDSFLREGRPFPRVFVPFLRELFDHGQALVDAHDEGQATLPVLITEAGQALLAELDDNREPDPPDHGDAHREAGAPTEPIGWSTTADCDDLAGRPRHATFFLTAEGHLALQVPAGEIAVLTRDQFPRFKQALDEGHFEMTAPWSDR